MLQRIGSGAAVSALFLAGLAIAASEDQCLLAWLCLAGALCVMLVSLAPWIPFVREALPSRRRVKQIERFWVEGDTLYRENLAEWAQWDNWDRRRGDWETRVHAWLEARVSLVEAQRFLRPTVIAHDVSGSL